MEFIHECMSEWEEVEDEWVGGFSNWLPLQNVLKNVEYFEKFGWDLNVETYWESEQDLEYLKVWVLFLGKWMAQ